MIVPDDISDQHAIVSLAIFVADKRPMTVTLTLNSLSFDTHRRETIDTALLAGTPLTNE